MSTLIPIEQGIMTTKTNAVIIAIAAILGIATSSIAIDASTDLRGNKWYDNKNFAITTNVLSIVVFISAAFSLAAQIGDFSLFSPGVRAVF